MILSDYVELNPRVVLPRDAQVPFVSMDVIVPGMRRVYPTQGRPTTGSGSKFAPGDTLFARITPCLENGKIAQYVGDRPGMGSTEFFVLRAREGISDPGYVYYFSVSKELRSAAEKSMSGASGRQRAVISSLSDFECEFPPLPVQRRIAGILSAYDNLIENNQRRIAILERMARALYREWFVHFRYPGHEGVPLVDSPLGEIPQGWEVVHFDQILASMTGGDWGSDQPNANDTESVLVVRGTDFEEVAYGGNIRAPIRYVKASSLASRRLQVGDVVIENSINAKSRSVGTTLLIDSYLVNRLGHDAIAASFCKVFRPHDKNLAPLIHLHARLLRETSRMEYYQNVAANGIANFQAQKFAKEERLILPADNNLRTKLTKPIAATFDEIGVLSSQQSNLRRTRDLLLPRLLSGQLDVGELDDA